MTNIHDCAAQWSVASGHGQGQQHYHYVLKAWILHMHA